MDCNADDTFGEVLRIAPDGPAYTGVDKTILVAGNIDGDDLGVY